MKYYKNIHHKNAIIRVKTLPECSNVVFYEYQNYSGEWKPVNRGLTKKDFAELYTELSKGDVIKRVLSQ
jgi:hypothetical protein